MALEQQNAVQSRRFPFSSTWIRPASAKNTFGLMTRDWSICPWSLTMITSVSCRWPLSSKARINCPIQRSTRSRPCRTSSLKTPYLWRASSILPLCTSINSGEYSRMMSQAHEIRKWSICGWSIRATRPSLPPLGRRCWFFSMIFSISGLDPIFANPPRSVSPSCGHQYSSIR